MKGSFSPIFRAVSLLGGFIYLTLFAAVGTVVIFSGQVVWRVDTLLYAEVVMWALFGLVCLKVSMEEVKNIGQ